MLFFKYYLPVSQETIFTLRFEEFLYVVFKLFMYNFMKKKWYFYLQFIKTLIVLIISKVQNPK